MKKWRMEGVFKGDAEKVDTEIKSMENVYSIDSIVSIFNLTGFGLGICSGKSSGFGRFHVERVK